MTNPSLPPALQQKLTSLAGHVRRLRLLRGLSLLFLVGALVFGVTFLADLALDLTEETFSWILTVGLVLIGLVALFGVIVPLRRRLDFEALAAAIEQQHPELAERLTSSVELTQGKGKHGSQEFIAYLLQETEKRTRNLVFRHAFPARSIRLLTGLAVIALILLSLPAFLMPERYGEFTGRFLLCWFAPPAMQIEVTPGDGYAALGKPLSWQVTLHRRDERIPWPENANLIYTDSAGRKKQILMQPQKDQTYTCSLDRVPDSIQFYIQAGNNRSKKFKIEAIEPVALSGKPNVTLTPPEYLNTKFHPVKTFGVASPFGALQFGSVKLDFPFTRPALAASVKITSGEKQNGQSWSLPVSLSQEGKSGALTLPMLPPGAYQLSVRMEAEQHIATEQDLPALTIRADQPPSFTMLPSFFGLDVKDGKTAKTSLVPEIAGQPGLDYGQASAIAPGDALHLKVGAADEEGLDRLEVEYRINNGPVQSEILSKAGGDFKIAVEHQLQLQGKIKDGDTVQFRLKAVDNRQVKAGQFQGIAGQKVPSNDLAPQVIFYPPMLEGKDQWLALKVDPKAGPLEKSEIVAQHDAVQKQIDAIKKKIEKERTDLNKLEQFGKNHPQWGNQESQKLTELRKDNRDTKNDLVDLSMKTLSIPELNPISFQAFQIAKKEMTQSDEAMQQAQQQKGNAPVRDKQLNNADQELAEALKKLEAMQKFNEQLAKNRLEQSQLKELAQKEEDLSKKVAALETKKPLDDPKLQDELNKLKMDQEKVAEQIQQLAQKNQLFQDALQKTQAEQALKLAMQAQELGKAQKDLAKEMNQAMAQQEKNILDEFAKKQQAIADKSKDLGNETTSHAKTRQIKPLNDKPAHDAADSLKKAAVVQALGEQEQSAQELKRLADGLDNIIEVAGDAGNILKNLIQKQKDLEERLLSEAKQVASKKDKDLFLALKEIYQGQHAIHTATQKLAGQQQAFAQVEDHAGQAVRALQTFNTLQAFDHMQHTRQALEQLALTAPAIKPLEPPKVNPNVPMSDDVYKQVALLRKLAKEQWELREQLQKYLTDPDASAPSGQSKPLKELSQKQQDLEKKGKELADAMKKLSQAHGDSPEAKKSAKEAAMSSEEAHKAMQKAKDQGEQGKGLSAKEAAAEAAKMLAEAAKQAEESAKQLGMVKPKSQGDKDKTEAQKQMAKNLQQGQQKADMAKDQLNQGKLGNASQSMKQAAQALKQSAQQMAKQMKQTEGLSNPARISFANPSPFALPDLKKYGEEGKKNSGKSWGELPGKLKTRILSDMRAEYGEEYAAIIQRYFEQQAELEQGKKE